MTLSPEDHRVVCGQKQSFETRPAANRQAVILKRMKGWALEPYQCPHCKKWHLTHGPKK